MEVFYYRSPNIRMFGEDRPLEFKYEDIIAFCPKIRVPNTSMDFKMSFSFENDKLVPFNVSNILSDYWVHLTEEQIPHFHKRCVEFFKSKNIKIKVSNKKLKN